MSGLPHTMVSNSNPVESNTSRGDDPVPADCPCYVAGRPPYTLGGTLQEGGTSPFQFQHKLHAYVGGTRFWALALHEGGMSPLQSPCHKEQRSPLQRGDCPPYRNVLPSCNASSFSTSSCLHRGDVLPSKRGLSPLHVMSPYSIGEDPPYVGMTIAETGCPPLLYYSYRKQIPPPYVGMKLCP